MENKADFSLESAIETALTTLNNTPLDEEVYEAFCKSASDFPFVTTSKGICKLFKKKSGQYYNFGIEPVSTYIRVKSKSICLETDEVKICLELYNGNNIVCHYFDRSIFTKLGIKELLKYGVVFFEFNCTNLLEYLMKSDRQSKLEHIHSALGWSEISGTPVFKSFEILTSSKDKLADTSKFLGELDIKPKGSSEKWLQMAKQDVLSYTTLTFCMALGFAPPLLAYLTDKYDLGTLVFTISSDSSKGKSTSAMLASSIFSNPILDHAMMRSFNMTQNYLLTFLSQSCGFPIVLDEAAVYNGDFEQLFYLIASGREKGRLNSDAHMKPERSWKSIVITTAEFALTEDSSPNGIKARCFNITDTLTTSAEQADRIKTTVTENYGVVGNQFVQWILDNKYSSIESDYIYYKNVLYSELENSEAYDSTLAKRILSKFAVILQTAAYISNCFSLGIDLEKFKYYLLDLERTSSAKTDLAATAIDGILQEISKSSARYLTSDNPYCHNAIGKVTEENDKKTISILKSEFESICKKNGLESKLILSKLKQRNILDCEPDRLTKRVRLEFDLPMQPCYVLKIKDNKSQRQYDSSERISANMALKDEPIEFDNNVNDKDLNF